MLPTKNLSRLSLDLGEVVILVTFWTFSLGIFVMSFSYSGFTGQFPRLFAALVLIGSTTLLIQNWLPEPVRKLITKTSDTSDSGDGLGLVDEADEVPATDENIQQNAEGRPIPDTWFITISVGVFFLFSYLIGMLWAAPIYALIYGRWYGKSWRYTVAMMATSFGICYAFFSVLNISITAGWLHELLGIA